ncbi:MAG: HYR domain-containing protein, partial [Psychrosphaera sp.]|nr:HYR domain-containing protein [Psychrosphaera sp.]
MFINKCRPVSTAFKTIIAMSSALFSSYAIAGEQVVTPATTAFNVSQGDSISFDVNYETANPVDETLTGLGLQLHFDSSKVSLTGLSNILATNKFIEGVVEDDTSNADNDANTDKFIKIVWADFTGGWPGVGTTPAVLYRATFSVNAGFSGTSKVNFAGDTAATYTLAATSVTLSEFVDQAPVFGEVTSLSVEATGQLTAVTLTPPVLNDAEDGVITPTASTTGPFALGNTIITWSATDSGNHTVSATQTLTITDNTAPTITPPVTQTVEATANQTPVTLGTATSTDLVDGTVTVTTTSTGPYSVGSHTINWSATDAQGNTATATSLVVVNDTTAPTLTAPANITAESISGDPINITLPTVTGTDLVDGQVTAVASTTGPFLLGETQVTWTATDTAGNAATVTQIITVTTPDASPTIATLADFTHEATGALTPVSLVAPVATDKEDGNLVAVSDKQGPFAVGTTLVTWSVTDSANQSAFSTQSIIITDTTAPTISAPDTQTLEATANLTPVTLGTATSTDLVDGTVTVTTTSTGPYAVGSHTISWSATDATGNTATATSLLVVSDTTAPSLTAPANITVESISGDPIDITLPTVTGTDLVDGQVTAVANNTGPFSPGQTSIIWTATDTAGNVATVTQTITVTTPDEFPSIEILAGITVEATGGFTAVTLVAPAATDKEDGVLVAVSNNQGPFLIGTTIITWTVTDSANQSALSTQNIIITDTLGPAITSPDTQTVEATANLTPVILDTATAIDLVDGTVAVTTTSAGPFSVGTHVINWSATDSRGNTTTATSLVVVNDTTAPSLTAPANITAESTSGEPIDVTLPTVIATDLVDGQVTAVANNTGPFASGQTQVTWTATDEAGNSTTVTQTITVTT